LPVDGQVVLRVCSRYPALEGLSLRGVSTDARTLCGVFRTCPLIHTLSLGGTRATGMEQVLQELAHTLTHLRDLDLSSLAITNGMLRRLEERCVTLDRLNLSRCSLSPCESGSPGRVLVLSNSYLRELKLSGIRIAATELRCPALEVLDVSTSQLSDAMLLPMVTGSRDLRVVSLSECRNVTDAAVKDMLTRCRELRSLDVSGCVCLTAEVLREAMTSAPKLEHLCMARCPLLTDLATFPVTSPQLARLHLSGCEALKAIELSSPSLREVVLSGCRMLSKVVVHCALLANLAVDGCEALLDMDLHVSVPALSMPESRGHLKELTHHNEAITSLSLYGFSTMHTLALRCPALLSLDLGRCCALTDACLSELSTSCPLLRHLNLEECEAVHHLSIESASLRELNLAGCKALASADLRCSALHSLVLEGCSALDVASITCAVRCLDLGTCRQLRELSLASDVCRALSIKGCLRISTAHVRCAALRSLDLSFCADLTDRALRTLGSACVVDLNISRCMCISNALIACMSQVFPRLQTVNLSYLSIDDDTLTSFLTQPLDLRDVELAACKELRFLGLEELLLHRLLPAMLSVDISYTRADEWAVTRWLTLCPALRSLKLNGCANLACGASGGGSAPRPADAAVGVFAPLPGTGHRTVGADANETMLEVEEEPSGSKHVALSAHPTLRQLSMVGCNNVTRLHLKESPALCEVNLRSCAGLVELSADKCATLRTLSAFDCAELGAVRLDGCSALDALDLRNCAVGMSITIDGEPVAARKHTCTLRL